MRLLCRLDLDTRDAMIDSVRRMRVLLDILPDVSAYRYKMTRHRTRRGWHIEIYSTLRLHPEATVALQAILNSDYRREAFNLFRAVSLGLAPSFWHAPSNWNVLHSEKLT